MTIDQFYKITHLFSTVIAIVIILYIWYKYYITIQKIGVGEKKMDFSLLFFVGTLIIWEFNLFDNDYRFESITSIMAISMLIMGFQFIEPENKKSGYRKNRSISIGILTILLIIVSQILFNQYEDNYLIGYSVCIVYMAFGFMFASIISFKYFKSKGFLIIGLLSLVLFLGLYGSIIGSVFNIETKSMFDYYKSVYLICSFGLLALLISLSFIWSTNYQEGVYSEIFLGPSKTVDDTSNSSFVDKDLLLRWIAEDKIDEVIEQALAYKKAKKAYLGDMLLIGSRIKRLNTSNLNGILSLNEYEREKNKIVLSLIVIVQNL